MRVGVIQSSFIPWRGYFDFIASVDLFIFYDDVQYSKNGWRNRNQVKTEKGLQWLTVPVRHRSLSQLIQDTEIDDSTDWRAKHLNVLKKAYADAPFLSVALDLLADMGKGKDKTISQLNIRLIKSICEYLQIKTPLTMSHELRPQGSKTDRLIDLLQKVKATTYLSGPSADNYLEKEKFTRSCIALEYKTYEYEPYPQVGAGFEGHVSVLDLIANCGHEAKNRIRSRSQNQTIAPV